MKSSYNRHSDMSLLIAGVLARCEVAVSLCVSVENVSCCNQ